jgi:hypothetical protein
MPEFTNPKVLTSFTRACQIVKDKIEKDYTELIEEGKERLAEGRRKTALDIVKLIEGSSIKIISDAKIAYEKEIARLTKLETENIKLRKEAEATKRALSSCQDSIKKNLNPIEREEEIKSQAYWKGFWMPFAIMGIIAIMVLVVKFSS